jgi:hypothetical protein
MRGLETSQRRCAVIAAIVASASVAGVTFAAPALAVHLEQYIEVPQCQPATSEDCPQVPTVTYNADQGNALIQAQFTANANHCSDISVQFSRDGYGPMSGWLRVGPGQTVSASFRAGGTGEHILYVAARGILGGCNTTGVLSAWGGTVRIDSIGEDLPQPTNDQRAPSPFGQIPDDPGGFVLPH